MPAAHANRDDLPDIRHLRNIPRPRLKTAATPIDPNQCFVWRFGHPVQWHASCCIATASEKPARHLATAAPTGGTTLQPSSDSLPAGQPIIEIRDLHKSFGNQQVLQGVSFSASQGEGGALIGASGSGKSTLRRCMNLLEITDRGRIAI